MIRLSEYYYIGEHALLREKEILASLNEGSAVPGVWLVTLSANKLEQLDILTSEAYFSRSNRERQTEIVGIACGKQEALCVVKEIADEVYRKHSAESIRDYFSVHG